MGIKQDIEGDWDAALAALAWQVELGADEAICNEPSSVYDMPEKAAWQQRTMPAPQATRASAQPVISGINAAPDALHAAEIAAQSASTRSELDAAAAAFEGCDLRKSGRGAIGAIGHEKAAVLILCDPPGLDAEKAGQALPDIETALLMQVFGAIGLTPDSPDPDGAFQLAPVLPWPLRGTLENQNAALAMMRPFVLRRIDLAGPKVVVVMGQFASVMLLGESNPTRARGLWQTGASVKTLVMLPPRSLLRNPAAKRDTWGDALALKAALRV